MALFKIWCFLVAMIAISGKNDQLFAQTAHPPLLSLTPADSLHKGRVWLMGTTAAAGYSATMVGLYHAWYADFPITKFHTINDNREWNQMDKMGHWLMSYQEARWTYGASRWMGFKPTASAWMGFAAGELIQTSFEVFDGFSAQWGWSWGDVALNTLGSGLFLGQQLKWKEQRIVMKMSAWPVKYSDEKLYPVWPVGSTQYTTMSDRAKELYGTGPLNLFLKNYNTLVVWASVNPRSFSRREDGWWPQWLNVAVGMGADNLFEGFGYTWQADKTCTTGDCITYQVDKQRFPRSRQLYLSLDLDLTRIPVKNRFLRSLLYTANIIKIPAPTLEWHQQNGLRFRPVWF